MVAAWLFVASVVLRPTGGDTMSDSGIEDIAGGGIFKGACVSVL